jgi:flagellar basal-body rod protein FlgF/flagellar basal-body rod protein FlgG
VAGIGNFRRQHRAVFWQTHLSGMAYSRGGNPRQTASCAPPPFFLSSCGTLHALTPGQSQGGDSCEDEAAMPYGIYLSAEGAAAQAQRLEVIANNLANVDTVGFKPDVPTFQSRFAEAIQQGLAREGDGSVNDLGGGVKLIDVTTDHSSSQLKETGGTLDLAITGSGFFHVRGDDGEQLLTRAGNFTLDAQGRLVTQNGDRPVLDQAGGEITLDSSQPFSISQDGFISQNGALVALGLSQPESLNELVKAGNNLFRPLGNIATVPLGDRQIRQGYLEMSGANPIRQMMAMIETTRAFEANTRMIQNQDTMLGALISRVLQS